MKSKIFSLFATVILGLMPTFAARPSYTYVNYEANGYTWHCRLKNGAEPLLQGATPALSGSVVIPSEIVLDSGEILPITGIDSSAFEELQFLVEITIPPSVAYLGESAFCCCDALSTVNLPESLRGKFDAESVFEECPNVKLVYYTHQPPTPPDSDTHVVTFNANGGLVDEASREIAIGTAIGELPVPMQDGFDFAGWWTQLDGGELVISDTIVDGEWETLYAHWEELVVPMYMIWLDAQGGRVAENFLSVQDGHPIGELPEPTRDGYIFRGWWTDLVGGMQVSSTTIIDNGYILARGDWLYAHWEELPFLITFNPGEGSVDEQVRQVQKGLSIGVLPVPVRTGYDFIGWFTAAEDGEQVDATTVPDGDVTYYAHWARKIVYHYVYLYADCGGDGAFVQYDRIRVVEGNTIGNTIGLGGWQSLVPAKDGYNFAGWWTEPTGGVEISAETAVSGELNAYSHWEAKVYHKISFNPNGGSTGEDAREVEEGSSIGDLPVPARTGYDFIGWFTAAEDGEQVDATTIPGGDVTYYAHWAKTIVYRCVCLYADLGTDGAFVLYNLIRVVEGNTIGDAIGPGEWQSLVPVKAGYNFAGWWTEPTGGVEISAETAVSGELDAYSHWEAKVYCTITFDANGGSGGGTARGLEKGTSLGVLPVPSRYGYSFKGWWTSKEGGSQIGADTIVAEDATYYARWDYAWTRTVENGEATLYAGVCRSVVPDTLSGSLAIPGEIDGDIVVGIGEYAFYGCSSLAEIVIPPSVRRIEGFAFQGCSSLTNIVIPASVEFVAPSAFSGCNGLASIEVEDGNQRYVSVDGVLYDRTLTTLVRCPSAKSGLQLPTSVTGMEPGAIDQCRNIADDDGYVILFNTLYSYTGSGKTVFVPEGVKTIAEGAFGSSMARTIIIPQSVEEMEPLAFAGCYRLSRVFLPERFNGTADISIMFDGYVPEGFLLEYYSGKIIQVLFDGNGATLGETSRLLKEGSAIGALPTPEFGGAVFEGWWTQPIGGEEVAEGTAVLNGCVLYAHWQQTWSYITTARGIEVTGVSPVTATLAIPSEIDAKPVVSIGYAAFKNCSAIRLLILPENLETIRTAAFSNCGNIGNVEIPTTLKSVEGDAFAGAYVNELHIPDLPAWCGIKFADGYANPIHSCAKVIVSGEEVENLDIPDGVESVGEYAFYNFDALKSVEVPTSVQSIGMWAFSGCKKLESVKLPTGLTNFCANAFNFCNSLKFDTTTVRNCKLLDGWVVETTSSAIGDLDLTGARGVANAVFNYNKTITNVTISSSMGHICQSMFFYCTNLTSVTIEDGVKSIGMYAFVNCANIREIYIPDSVVDPGLYLFTNCSKLRKVRVPQSIAQRPRMLSSFFYGCPIEEVVFSDNVVDIGYAAFEDFEYISNITLPPNLESIGPYAFQNCTNSFQGKLELPEALRKIGRNAFYGCTGISELKMYDGIVNIPEQAFDLCKAMKTLTLSRNLTNISSRAFFSTSVEALDLPDKITDIGTSAFRGCGRLTTVKWPRNLRRIDAYAFANCGFKNVVVPEGVVTLAASSFGECRNLVEVSIPTTAIGDLPGHAFSSCENIAAITIPQSVCSRSVHGNFPWSPYISEVRFHGDVVDIANGAFQKLHHVAEIDLPNGVTNIGDRAFKDLVNLRRITLPSNLKRIGEEAFYGCSSLGSLSLPSNLESIGDGAFCWCSSLRSVAIPGNVRNLPNKAFTRCEALSSVSLQNGLQTIGYEAFSYCRSLSTMRIPSTVEGIGSYAFSFCDGLTSLTIPPGVEYIAGGIVAGCDNLRYLSLPFYGSSRGPHGDKQSYSESLSWVLGDGNPNDYDESKYTLVSDKYHYYNASLDRMETRWGTKLRPICLKTIVISECEPQLQVAHLSNVMASQRNNSNLVDIYYNLAATNLCSVSITLVNDGVGIAANKLYQDVGSVVSPGRNKHIIWDAGADWPDSCGTLVATVTAGGASAQSAPFAVDTRASSDEFRIEDVRSSYCNGEYGGIGGRKATFLSGVDCTIDFSVRAGTETRAVDHLLVNGKRFDGKDFSCNVGELSPGGRVDVVAVDASGRKSRPFRVNFDMADYPPMWSHATNLSAFKYPDRGRIVYASNEINWFFLFDAIEEFLEISEVEEAMPIVLVPTVRTVQTMESDTAQYHIATETGGKLKVGQVLKGEVELFGRGSQNHEWVASDGDWMRIPSSFAVCFSASCYAGVHFFNKLAYGKIGISLSAQVPIEYVDGYWQYGFEVDPFISLWGTLGAGCPGIAAAEGTFDAAVFFKFYAPSPPGENKNEGGYRAQLQFKYTVGPFEKTIPIVIKEGWFYGGPSRGGLRQLFAALPDDESEGEYRLIPRDYVQTPTGRSAKLLKASPVADSLGDGYPNPAPSLAANGASDHLVYLRDNISRSDINRTELVCRSGVSNEWSAAETVWDDGTADFMPSVAVGSDGTAYATWANLHEVLSDDSEFETVCANLEIAVGVRDAATGCWNCTNLTDDAVLDKAPVIKVAGDGSAAVAWIRNEEGDFFGSDEHPSSVMVSYYRNGVWSAPEKIADAAFVSSMDLEYDGSTATVAVDDGAGEGARTYDMAAIPRIDGGTTVVWWQADESKVDGKLLCADYDVGNDSVGEPLELERFDGVQLRNITGAMGGDGALRLAYEEVSVSTNAEGTVEYGAVKLKTLRREVAASVDFPSDAFAFADDADVSIGALADVKVNVANAGVVASDELEVWLWFGDSEYKSLLGVVVTNVPPLSAIALSLPWYVEEGLTNVSFTAEIRNPTSGQVSRTRVWRPDFGDALISLRDVQCVNATETLRLVGATIHNDGVAPLEPGAVVRFWRGEIGGELLGTDTLGMVTAGDGGEWRAGMALDVSAFSDFSEVERVVIEVAVGSLHPMASVMVAKDIAHDESSRVITEDALYEGDDFVGGIEMRSGVRISVRPKSGQVFTEADAQELASKVTIAYGREGQAGRCFTAVGRISDGMVVISSKIDEGEVGLADTINVALNDVVSSPAKLSEEEWTFPSECVEEGFYYGVAAAGTIEALNALEPVLAKADANGATVVIVKPSEADGAPTERAAFFKIIVSDVAE